MRESASLVTTVTTPLTTFPSSLHTCALQIGGIFVQHLIETQLGGMMAVMVAVGVLEPSRDVYRIAEDILKTLEEAGDGFGVRDDRGSDGEDVAMDVCVNDEISTDPKQVKGTKSSKEKKKKKEKNNGNDVDGEYYSPSEKVLQVFAFAALHARVNYRKHSRDMKHNPAAEALFADLLCALSTCELELSIYPTGNQGAVWTEGDILHYWRYCVNATLQKVDMTRNVGDGKKERRHDDDDNDDNQNDVECMNKFYAPMMSSQIKQRWSDIGLDLQEKDFFELRTVRQRRLLIKERMEVAESESGADIDECQATSGDHSSGSSGDEAEGEGGSQKLDAKAKKALARLPPP